MFAVLEIAKKHSQQTGIGTVGIKQRSLITKKWKPLSVNTNVAAQVKGAHLS